MGQAAQKLPTNGPKLCPSITHSPLEHLLPRPAAAPSCSVTFTRLGIGSRRLIEHTGRKPYPSFCGGAGGGRQSRGAAHSRKKRGGGNRPAAWQAAQTSHGRRQAGAAVAMLHCQAGIAGLTGRRPLGRRQGHLGGQRHTARAALHRSRNFVAVIAISSMNL